MAGRLVIICGPSGVGKSTLAAALLERRPDLGTVASWTTRPPRPGDGRGKSYRHVTREEFERERTGGGFLESAEVHGELYGTPRAEVERLLAEERDVLLEIDVQGAEQVKERMPGALTLFIEPPTWAELEARLRARATEDEARLRVRLATARREMAEASRFDRRVVNDDLAEAVDEVDRILRADARRG